MKQKSLEWFPSPFLYCSICNGPDGPETHDNFPFGMVSLVSEPKMNAAGRTSEHPFRDLRAAAWAHRRTKRHARRNSGAKHAYQRMTRTARHQDTYTRIERREWEDDWEAEHLHKLNVENMDAIVAYQCFGRNATIIEEKNNGDEGVYGEDFGAWARRRISEMRDMKEARIRSTLLVQGTRSRAMHPVDRIPQTTLPTSESDIRAHRLLTSILTPNKHFLRSSRRKGTPPLPSIRGFQWFGEYAWQWHRNMSGCWILGYNDECSGWSFPCSCCCCSGSPIMSSPCSCKEFGVGKPWEQPAPEEAQTCALLDWASGGLRGVLWDATARNEELWDEERRKGLLLFEGVEKWTRQIEEGNKDRAKDESWHGICEEWDMLSNAESSVWSVVSETDGVV
ncbi:hypothetical protein EJ02DRAFT_455566 [Clathrospora elynae]|uniref:Uncharacterized protein n=1 Tax=Clathrospora elynae TaxID=706981 RepID=A0A6A5SMU6_9PLEO|nr:hypothetical protein EJ02DRAFT_455566 [Clathrospora elynae]